MNETNLTHLSTKLTNQRENYMKIVELQVFLSSFILTFTQTNF